MAKNSIGEVDGLPLFVGGEKMIIDSKWYDILAWMNRVFLPALATLVAAILALCKVNPETIALISGIFTAVIAFLGAILQDSKNKYDALQAEVKENGEHG